MQIENLTKEDWIILNTYILQSMNNSVETLTIDLSDLSEDEDRWKPSETNILEDIKRGKELIERKSGIPAWVFEQPSDLTHSESSMKAIEKYLEVPYENIKDLLDIVEGYERGVYLFRLEKGM